MEFNSGFKGLIRLSIFLLRLSYRASVSNCRLPSMWFWLKNQGLCHVAALLDGVYLVAR